jgi:hypothetical protein
MPAANQPRPGIYWSNGPAAAYVQNPDRFRRRRPASLTPQLERAWDAWQAERYQHGEIGQRPGYADNPFRPR